MNRYELIDERRNALQNTVENLDFGDHVVAGMNGPSWMGDEAEQVIFIESQDGDGDSLRSVLSATFAQGTSEIQTCTVTMNGEVIASLDRTAVSMTM